jgi:hypothetical protein
MSNSESDNSTSANRRDAERQHDRIDQFIDSVNQAAVNSGLAALRTAVIVNGGAAVVLLTFIGGLISSNKIGGDEIDRTAASMMWFALGVAAALLGLLLGYAANYTSGAAARSLRRTWNHPFQQAGPHTMFWTVLNYATGWAALLAGVCSIGLFVGGLFAVYNSITSLML